MTTIQEWRQDAQRDPWRWTLDFVVLPILGGQPYAHQNEFDLCEQLGGVFELARVPFRTEVTLGRGARIDFVVSRIGVEVKTGGSPFEVYDQLARYGRIGVLDGVLLLTTCTDHYDIGDAAGYAVPTAGLHLAGRRLPGGVRQQRHRAR